MFSPPQQPRKHGLHLLGIFFAGQFVTQAINGVTGITLVRLLPKNEYAWLTVANAMTASFSVMLDPVIGVGLQALVAPVRNDPPRLMATLGEAVRWQWKWTAFIALGTVPLSAFLLLRSGASPVQSTAILTASLTAVPALSAAMIFGNVPKVHGHLRELQLADVIAAVSRLLLSAGSLIAARLAALTALASSAAQWVQASLLRSAASSSLDDVSGARSSATAAALSTQMRQILPHSLFLCVQGHIGIWLLGCFGTTSSLADLGALMRLGMLLAWVGIFAQQVLIPTLSRRESPAELGRLAVTSLVLGLFGGALLAGLSWWLPQPFLWLLGPAYAHLRSELVLAMLFFSLSTLTTVIWWFNASRSWVNLAVWVPLASVAAYAVTCLCLRPSNTMSALVVLISGQVASSILAVLQTRDGLHLLRSNEKA